MATIGKTLRWLLLFITFRRQPPVFRIFHRKTSTLESVFSKVAGLRACDVVKNKLRHGCFPVRFAKFFRIPILKNICRRLLLHFRHNSHHHFYYRHFLYHRKMHLYRLKILLTIPLDWNIIPCLFQLNLSSFFPHIFFFSLIPSFSFLRSVKGLRIYLRSPDKF